MIEWANFGKEFISEVGFPVAIAIVFLWLSYRSACTLWSWFTPKADGVVSAIVDFLKTTSQSIDKQTEILLVMSGVQREQGHVLNQLLHGEYERHSHARLSEELEDDHGGRCSGPGSDLPATVNRV